jgi:hypothetical protein
MGTQTYIQPLSKKERRHMGHALYTALTARAGMYICYLVPLVYLYVILAHILKEKRTQQKRISSGDIVTILALILVSLDFLYYLYLFFSRTGRLLGPNLLFLKYTVGGVLWLWIIGYSYLMYFAPKAAGANLKSRYLQLLGVVIGTCILGGIGILIS